MFQLAISIGLVALAAIIVCTILGTLLRKDFSAIDRASKARKAKKTAKAKSAISGQDESESQGLKSGRRKQVDSDDVYWKKLNGDVFRTPEFPNIYACFIGVGA